MNPSMMSKKKIRTKKTVVAKLYNEKAAKQRLNGTLRIT